jgi:hypothetical protein
MLAHLRRRWSLNGRDGFGGRIRRFLWKWNVYFPLRRRRRNEGERKSLGDQTLDQTLDRMRLARPVSSSRVQRQGSHWRVWSSPRETAKHAKSIGRGGASGHDRPDASGREWVLTGIDRTLALWHPVSTSGASGHVVSNVNQYWPDA